MKELTIPHYTTIYDYFDKYGHGDGEFMAAGYVYMYEAKSILKEELEKEFPGFTFNIIEPNQSTLHNECMLIIEYKGKDSEDYKELDIYSDSIRRDIAYDTAINHESSFDIKKLKSVFKRAERRFV